MAEWPLADQVAFGAFRRLRGTGADVTCGQLIVVEGVLSQTGSVADLRVRCHPDVYATVAWGVAAALAQRLNKSIPADVASQLATIAAGNNLGAALGLKPIHGVDAIAFIAGRLAEVHAAGQRVVLAAGPACGAAVASATQQIAALLGDPDAAAAIPPSTDENLRKILARCAAGEISTLLIAGVNPAYLLGHDAAAMKALTTVKTLVVLDDRLTETALLGHFVAPTLHDLESWGDAGEDIASLQQPCIQPLWNARAWQESLLAFAVAAGHAPASFRQAKVAIKPEGQAVAVISRSALYQPATDGVQSWAAFVQAVWSGAVLAALKPAGDARSFWQAVLARGHVELPNSGRASENNSALPQTLAKQAANGFRLVLTPSRALGAEGRWLNNAWLQELPDPVSKITWDNYCALSPHDAMELGIRENDVVKISIDSSSVRLPVHVQEGQQPGVLESFLGWGRAKGSAGAVADLGIETGFSINLWPLAAQLGSPASVEKTGETWPLALAQGHQRMEGRAIALDDVLELHRRDPGKRQREHRVHAEPAISLNVSEHQTPGRKWGMAIDLSLCTGCNACVAACNAENNIPVVGRDEVRKGRLMHWLRIDRYYISENGDQLDVEAVHQPVMCQHCDHAPCEEVCPATATVHNDEGQNVMVYNRCIGTRYCSNNCPYKVRRFNWYEYSKYRLGPIGAGAPLLRIANNFRTTGATSAPAELAPMPLQMLLNPEVTVRSRGVMEKCSFCVQRTREVREHEKADGKRLPDGAITSACAQTCPTAAIVFGDLNDDTSAVSQAAAQGHGYKLLDEELNTRPAVTYLARIRNRPATTGEKGDP